MFAILLVAGAIIETNDVNKVNGVSFLDLSRTIGQSRIGALSSAREDYPTAALATPQQTNNLFAEFDFIYTGDNQPSDAWETGLDDELFAGQRMKAQEFLDVFDITNNVVFIWTDPDGHGDDLIIPPDILNQLPPDAEDPLTRDMLSIVADGVDSGGYLIQTQNTTPRDDIGWLVVVTEPNSMVMWMISAIVAMGALRSARI